MSNVKLGEWWPSQPCTWSTLPLGEQPRRHGVPEGVEADPLDARLRTGRPPSRGDVSGSSITALLFVNTRSRGPRTTSCMRLARSTGVGGSRRVCLDLRGPITSPAPRRRRTRSRIRTWGRRQPQVVALEHKQLGAAQPSRRQELEQQAVPRVPELHDALDRRHSLLANDWSREGPRQLFLVLDLRPVRQ